MTNIKVNIQKKCYSFSYSRIFQQFLIRILFHNTNKPEKIGEKSPIQNCEKSNQPMQNIRENCRRAFFEEKDKKGIEKK